MIEINHVSKSFGHRTVLDDVTMTVNDCSIYGLVGYNGAGKTTLLNLIAGLYQPNGGNITVDTTDGKLSVYECERVKRDIFYVPDEPYILPQASILTMADFYRGFYPSFSIDVLKKLTDLFGLDAKKRIHNFSKGMKRQAALILGLSAHTRYLLLDESFDGLDPDVRQTVCDLLMEYMADTGATILMASHNLHEIQHICDSVGMLSGSQIVYSCEMQEVQQKYTHIRVGFDAHVDITEAMLEDLTCGDVSICGQVVTFMSEMPAETVKKTLEGRGRVCLFETYTPSLEDIFRYETRKGGKTYDLEGIFG